MEAYEKMKQEIQDTINSLDKEKDQQIITGMVVVQAIVMRYIGEIQRQEQRRIQKIYQV